LFGLSLCNCAFLYYDLKDNINTTSVFYFAGH
jgi:hypothetical protein